MKGIFRIASLSGLVPVALMALSLPACAGSGPGAGEQRFRETYRELVETDTSLSTGSCTLAAQRMQARLKEAGFSESDARVIIPDDFPKQGNLVARLAGRNSALPAVLLIAHIDVVEAKRSDWDRDPFTLFEENGYFYARGTVDDKAMAASFVDAMVRLKEDGYTPDRTLKMALTCGEETDDVFNGVQYLLKHEPDTLKAGWAINEGGKGSLDKDRKFVSFGVQSGEKVYQDFILTVTAPGGHSARPTDDNAIVSLSAALVRIGQYKFPVNLTETSRGFFANSANLFDGQLRKDMEAVGTGMADQAAYDRIARRDPLWNAYLRTTCIPSLVKGGHAPNAQPQHVEANVNCRIMPGERIEDVKARLEQLAADPRVKIKLAMAPGPQSPAPSLSPQVMKPIKRIVGDMWPDVPIIPTLSSGATDGRFLNAAGIATYGVSGIFVEPGGTGAHGLNEHVLVQSLLNARIFLYRLIRAYTGDEKS